MDRYRIDCQDHYDTEKTPDGWLVMYDDVEEAIASAVAAEREACAKACEVMANIGGVGGWSMASAIRARSNAE